MATIMRQAGGLPAEKDEQTTLEKLLLGGLVAWICLGVFLGIWYANLAILGEWDQSAILSVAPHGGVMLSRSSSALYNFFTGAVIWFSGMALLMLVAWRNHARGIRR